MSDLGGSFNGGVSVCKLMISLQNPVLIQKLYILALLSFQLAVSLLHSSILSSIANWHSLHIMHRLLFIHTLGWSWPTDAVTHEPNAYSQLLAVPCDPAQGFI